MRQDKPLTLVLGGARSGKSTFAERLAAGSDRPVLYVATAEVADEEMRRRVDAHQRRRPPAWRTLETRRNVAEAIASARKPGQLVLVEDLALLTSNYLVDDQGQLVEGTTAEELESALEAEVAALCELEGPVILVSNEVGLGVVPPYLSGRLFRDALGRINQTVAARADRVYLLVAGIPLTVKGD